MVENKSTININKDLSLEKKAIAIYFQWKSKHIDFQFMLKTDGNDIISNIIKTLLISKIV